MVGSHSALVVREDTAPRRVVEQAECGLVELAVVS